MKPPICYLCNIDFRSEYFHFCTGGDLVHFSDYQPLQDGAAGHPHGLEWFCQHHLLAAQELSVMKVEEALLRLRATFGEFPPYEPKPLLDPELWVASVGPNPGKVFAITRQATQLSPSVVKQLLCYGEFKVAQSCPKEFEYWQSLLARAGARLEIRFP